ncbi:MAG: hypothetical protein CMI16_02810 [Opitutaceae bacterium]|nr:hypothetical protein [Opitutaceae bacterium]
MFEGVLVFFAGVIVFVWCARRVLSVVAAQQRVVLRDNYEGGTRVATHITNLLPFMRRASKAKDSPKEDTLTLLPVSP